MSDRYEDLPTLLPRIRRLQADRDHASIVGLLDPLDWPKLLEEPALGYALAVAYRTVGRPGDALRLALDLREPCARRGRDRLYRQRLNLEAALEFEAGELERAGDLWQELLNEATEGGDHDLVAKASNNLGILHTLAGRPWAALTAYSRALVANRRLGDRRGLAQAHQNLAITFREAGYPREADSHFREAVAHAAASQGTDVLGRAEEERALLFLVDGDPGMAEVSAQRAYRRLDGAGDVAGAAEALRVLGLVALAEGRKGSARDRLEEALELSRTVGNRLLEAETLEALAGLARLEDRQEEAERQAAAAARIFTAMGATSWGERARARVGELLSA